MPNIWVKDHFVPELLFAHSRARAHTHDRVLDLNY